MKGGLHKGTAMPASQKTPEGERHGRSLSRCRLYRRKRPSRNGANYRVYVKGRPVGDPSRCRQKVRKVGTPTTVEEIRAVVRPKPQV
jgi:hypothetical protein